MCLFNFTNLCQLTCKHCYVSSSPEGEYGIPVNLVYEFLDEVYRRYGSLTLAISGGEALMRKEDTLSIIAYASKLHDTMLLTNGILIDEEIAKELKKYNTYVQVSIDGDQDRHDYLRGKNTFKKTCRGLLLLNDAGICKEKLILSAVIYDENVKLSASEILNIANQYNVGTVKMETLVSVGTATKSFEKQQDIELVTSEKFNELFDQLNFFEGWSIIPNNSKLLNTLCVYSGGEVFPFTSFFEQDKLKNNIGYLGNIYSKDWKDIFDKEKLSNIILSTFAKHIYSGKKRYASYLFKKI